MVNYSLINNFESRDASASKNQNTGYRVHCLVGELGFGLLGWVGLGGFGGGGKSQDMVEGREGQREQRLHRIFPPLTVVMDLAEMQFAFCD